MPCPPPPSPKPVKHSSGAQHPLPHCSAQQPILQPSVPSPALGTLSQVMLVELHHSQFLKADVLSTKERATWTMAVKMTQPKGLRKGLSEPWQPESNPDGLSLRDETLKVLSTGKGK